ncbi:MAG: alcohol dehydrogenase catalytic domain-containing protein [Anaerolineae bacterium]|nr:alcohol dehydrogenase catalytic domain-containing protein [Anaerolineae bacterium]
MRALFFDGTLKQIEDVPLPRLAPDEVLIRTRSAGICNTDLELIRGMYGFCGVPGHEFCGEVVDGPQSLLGKRVAGEINISCGECRMCRPGMTSQCLARRTMGIHDYPGVFADFLRLPLRNLHIVPEGVSDEAAVFTEPLAAALQVTEAVHIRPGTPVLVIGAGKLGLLIAQVLHLTGAVVSVVVRHEKQTRLLRGWGITALRVDELESQYFPVVVEVSGAASGLETALRLVRSRGTVVLKSTFHGKPQVDMTQVAVREIAIVGSRCGPFAPAIQLLEQGLVDVNSLIEGSYALQDGLQAFERAALPGTLKILFRFSRNDTDPAAVGA